MKFPYFLSIFYYHKFFHRNQTHRDSLPSTVTQFKFSVLEAKGPILLHRPLIMKGENQIEIHGRVLEI
jgi:hypothetical protein